METLIASYAALAVAGIFCVYQCYVRKIVSRQRVLRERVAYMLWVMANGNGTSDLTSAKT